MTDYTEQHCMDAIAIHEELEDRRRVANPTTDKLYDALGAAGVRLWCIRQARHVQSAYEAAVSEGYGNCFDWEFIPAYLDAMEPYWNGGNDFDMPPPYNLLRAVGQAIAAADLEVT